MLLLSRIFPKLKQKSDKGKGVTSEADLIRHGDKPPAEFNCKVILLDDSELALNVKVSFSLIKVCFYIVKYSSCGV